MAAGSRPSFRVRATSDKAPCHILRRAARIGVPRASRSGSCAAAAAASRGSAIPGGRADSRSDAPCGIGAAGELLAPVVVVALRAGEIELALAAVEGRAAGLDERLGPRVVWRPRSACRATAVATIGGERQQVLALVGERRRLLPLGAAEVDALLEVDRPAARRRRTPDSAPRRPSCWCCASPWQSAQDLPARAGLARSTAPRRRAPTACRDWRCRRPASRWVSRLMQLVAGAALDERDFARRRDAPMQRRGKRRQPAAKRSAIIRP